MLELAYKDFKAVVIINMFKDLKEKKWLVIKNEQNLQNCK